MSAKSELQRRLLPMLRRPAFEAASRKGYELCAGVATACFRAHSGVRAALLRTDFDHRYFRLLISDVDFLLVCDDALFRGDPHRLRRLSETTRRLMRAFPIFDRAAYLPESRLATENQLVLNAAVLGDSVLKFGSVDIGAFAVRYAPERSLLRASRAMWWYAARVHPWLFPPIAQGAIPNWEKLFFKLARYAGVDELPTFAMLDEIAGLSGGRDPASDLRARAAERDVLEAVFLRLLFVLRDNLAATSVFATEAAGEARSEGPTDDGEPSVDGCASDLSDPSEVVRAAELGDRIGAALRRSARLSEIVVTRSSEYAGFVVYCVVADEDLSVANLRSLRTAWQSFAASATPSIARYTPYPIIVDATLLRCALLADPSQGEWLGAAGRPALRAPRSLRRRALLLAAENLNTYLTFSADFPGALDCVGWSLPALLLQLNGGAPVFDPRAREALLARRHPEYYRIHCELAAACGERTVHDRVARDRIEDLAAVLARRVQEAAVGAGRRWDLPMNPRLPELRAVT